MHTGAGPFEVTSARPERSTDSSKESIPGCQFCCSDNSWLTSHQFTCCTEPNEETEHLAKFAPKSRTGPGAHRCRRQDCDGVLLTDESRVHLDNSRRRGEQCADACVGQRRQYNGDHVMVWRAIKYHVVHNLPLYGNLRVVRYRGVIIRPQVKPLSHETYVSA